MKLSYADSLKSISNLSTQLKSSLETNINYNQASNNNSNIVVIDNVTSSK